MAPIGETSLTTLLSTLTLTLDPTTYVFVTIPTSEFVAPFPIPLDTAVLIFREAEGVTVISPFEIAKQYHFTYQYKCRMITCAVHSSLEAVGFLAVMTRLLADKGISCNPVSAYFHDHLFVPEGKEHETVEVLEELARKAREELEGDTQQS
jgi:hypothetical protein